MADLVWPAVLVPAAAKLSLLADNTSGGVSFDGSEQIVGNTPGRLMLEYADIHIGSAAQIAAWKTLEFAASGRLRSILAPVFEWSAVLAPWPRNAVTGKRIKSQAALAAYVQAYPGEPALTTYPFTDTSGTLQCLIGITTSGDTPAGAVVATLVLAQGAAPAAGMSFEAAERVHVITAITGVSGANYSVTFSPPARADIASGTQLNFDAPKLITRMQADDAMAIKGGFALWRNAKPALVLAEYL